MVKFFETKDNWNWMEKWNWVSDSDRFIGFDAISSCCENFGYYYTDKIDGEESSYLYEIIHKKLELCDNNFELGEVVINEKGDFSYEKNYAYVEILDKESNRLICYLVLYNCHNGFYSHGLHYKTININEEYTRL